MFNVDFYSWNFFTQLGIFVFGAGAILLVARKNKWGFVLGLLSQPFWFAAAYINKQWGIMALNFIYLATWIYGIYEWFYATNQDAAKGPKVLVCECKKHAQIITSKGLYVLEESSKEELLMFIEIEEVAAAYEDWFSKAELETLKTLVRNSTLTEKICEVENDLYFRVLDHSDKLMAYQRYQPEDVHRLLFGKSHEVSEKK